MLESSYETRHPALLPCYHPVTDLIIRHYHVLEGHLGTSQVLSSIRCKFWIVKGGTAVRKIIDKCMECKLRNARPVQQMMAPLPAWQASEGNYPFEYVGVDLFGPFVVKRGRTLCKRYGCLFTCLKMRAVHIEMVHTLTTDSFVLALHRFINRRGVPKMMFSDRGTNFVGCHAELKEYFEGPQTRVQEELLKRNIEWHFNPPHASHRGGLWERLIGIIKRILSSIIKNQSLNDETLETFLCEAERILNDRPLSPVRDDVKDFDVLTPNKLLLLRGNPGIEDSSGEGIPTIKRWKQARHMKDIFWKRWLKEYVLTLQTRDKWKKLCRNLKVGDIVLVADKCATGRWPLGVVVRLLCSGDGLVRTVEVRTSCGMLVRDIRKLCLLEGAESRESEDETLEDFPT
uniref:Integrase catalytic domain-containing protein n=1 Tax=Trichobilharzia regenti TaxID=157069 RepID=A0AA85JVS2_TRIRE|nr:unnamed protein product [Trichobilharzia regenti]